MAQEAQFAHSDDSGEKRVAFLKEMQKQDDVEMSAIALRGEAISPTTPTTPRPSVAASFSFRQNQSTKSIQEKQEAARAFQHSIETREDTGALTKQNSCTKMIFGIGPATRGSASSVLIHPNSPFYVTSSFLIAIFLLYTAVVTPVMVSFYWDQEACVRMPTLEFDILVDCFFLVDIAVTFFVGIYHEGKYVDEHCFVVTHYIRHGFFFDLFTSFPVSFMEAAILAECDVAGESGIEISPSSLRMIRVVKPLRLFKLVRIIKVIKTLAIADAIADRFRVPPQILRLIKVLSGIALGVHTCASVFWLCKVLSRTPEQILEFREVYEISDSVEDQYAACFYFITTIITTIGFGDFVPENTTERIFSIVVMYIGSMMFGILLAEVQQVVAQASQDARQKDAFISTLLDFMNDNDIPRETENEVIRWAQFDFNQKQTSRKQTEVLGLLPKQLRRKLVQFLHKDSLEQIPLFSELSHPSSKDLLLDLYAAMTSMTFYPDSMVCESSQTADRLFLVASGVARVDITPLKKGDARAVKRVRSSGVEEYSDDDPSDSDSDGTDAQGEKELILLSLGDYFGENSLLGETDYGATLPGFFVTITAVTMLMCMILTRENFREIVATYPFSLQEDVRGMEEDYHLAKKKKKKVEKAKHAQIIFKWGKLVGKLRSSFGIGKASTGLSDRFGKRLLRKLTVTAGSAASDEDVWSQDRRGGDTMSSEEDRASESAQSREPAGIDSFSRRGAAWTEGVAPNEAGFSSGAALQQQQQLNLKVEELGAQMKALAQLVAMALPQQPLPQQHLMPHASDQIPNGSAHYARNEHRSLLPIGQLPNGGTSDSRANGNGGGSVALNDETEPEIVYISAA